MRLFQKIFRSEAPGRADFLVISQKIRNFEVKFEIRGISDENEAGNILYELRSRLYLEPALARQCSNKLDIVLAYPQTCIGWERKSTMMRD